MATEAVATLYLETWQKRMLRDFSKMKNIRDITKIIIKPGKGDCLASYKIPAMGMRVDDWLIYLTDEQVLQVKEQLKLRTAVHNLNITKEAIDAGAVMFK